MPDPDPRPLAPPQPGPDVVASRLQARFEGLEGDRREPARASGTGGPRPAAVGTGSVPRSGARSDAPADQRQLDHLQDQLLLLRDQLDVAFDELDQRLEAAETRATVAEARANVAEARAGVAEARAADAELRANEALELFSALGRRIGADDRDDAGGSLRGALDRLRGRLDAGSA